MGECAVQVFEILSELSKLRDLGSQKLYTDYHSVLLNNTA